MERIDDGEVSPYLTEELRAGDELELRGPIGGYFNWRNEDGGPLLLIAGGSGLVPLMAMLRHRAARASTADARLLLSARSFEDVLYREELGELAAGNCLTAHYTLTREPPPDWEGFARRIVAEMLMTVGPAPARGPRRPTSRFGSLRRLKTVRLTRARSLSALRPQGHSPRRAPPPPCETGGGRNDTT